MYSLLAAYRVFSLGKQITKANTNDLAKSWDTSCINLGENNGIDIRRSNHRLTQTTRPKFLLNWTPERKVTGGDKRP